MCPKKTANGLFDINGKIKRCASLYSPKVSMYTSLIAHLLMFPTFVKLSQNFRALLCFFKGDRGDKPTACASYAPGGGLSKSGSSSRRNRELRLWILKCRGDVLIVGPRGTDRAADHSVANIGVLFDPRVPLRGDLLTDADGERLAPTGEGFVDQILLPLRLSYMVGSGSFWTGEFECRSSLVSTTTVGLRVRVKLSSGSSY
jgi:hypothetical protein